MLGKLVDFSIKWVVGYRQSTKENDFTMWIVGGLEVSESILVH